MFLWVNSCPHCSLLSNFSVSSEMTPLALPISLPHQCPGPQSKRPQWPEKAWVLCQTFGFLHWDHTILNWHASFQASFLLLQWSVVQQLLNQVLKTSKSPLKSGWNFIILLAPRVQEACACSNSASVAEHQERHPPDTRPAKSNTNTQVKYTSQVHKSSTQVKYTS